MRSCGRTSLFGPFFGVWRFGSKYVWKHLENGFKMVSRWSYGVKNDIPGALGFNSLMYGYGCSGGFRE
jgi:hypothetical protein